MDKTLKTKVTSAETCRQQVHAWIDRYFDQLEAQLSQLATRAKHASAPVQPTREPNESARQPEQPVAVSQVAEQDATLQDFFRYLQNQA